MVFQSLQKISCWILTYLTSFLSPFNSYVIGRKYEFFFILLKLILHLYIPASIDLIYCDVNEIRIRTTECIKHTWVCSSDELWNVSWQFWVQDGIQWHTVWYSGRARAAGPTGDRQGSSVKMREVTEQQVRRRERENVRTDRRMCKWTDEWWENVQLN